MNFFCIDIETANESLASICQIGIATFIDGLHVPHLDIETYVNPEDDFNGMNISIHGIDEDTVTDAPTFPAIHAALMCLSGHHVLCHGHYDRVGIQRACDKYSLPAFTPRWVDTLRVARRVWPERWKNGGHSLSKMASLLNIPLEHHRALPDAICCGHLFLHAARISGQSLEEWSVRCWRQEKGFDYHTEGNPDGHLYGEVVTFTGELMLPRKQMVALASEAGCTINGTPTKHTTIVVVGIQDARKLRGQDLSAKHRKARELAESGQSIRIITEEDFLVLLSAKG